MSQTFRRVLMVDDDQSLCRVVARTLSARGIESRQASTVREAQAAIAQERPDLLLLDINLPDRTGWELLRIVGREGIKIPTVVISATRIAPERLTEFKPTAYLPKPFPIEALLRIVMGPEPAEEAANP
jgi:DNA-binding response OmpR family regulator